MRSCTWTGCYVRHTWGFRSPSYGMRNNTFSFHRIDWRRLGEAAIITTVSRYMKQLMQGWGVNPLVIPNGLPTEALVRPERQAVGHISCPGCGSGRCSVKWLGGTPISGGSSPLISLERSSSKDGGRYSLPAAALKRTAAKSLATAARAGLRVAERAFLEPGIHGLLKAMENLEETDVVSLRSAITLPPRRVLFHAASAVLANSGHEPFGLVGLETMAVGGVACTGCSGEDYAVPGYNALVLETNDPREFTALFSELRANPRRERSLRRAGSATAKQYMWAEIIQHLLLPRIHFLAKRAMVAAPEASPQAQQARPHPCLLQDDSTPPQLVEWMADRLKRRHSSREDCDRAHVAIVK